MLPATQTVGSYFGDKLSKRRQQKPPVSHDDDSGVQKKLMHRNIERQRRQEMTTLYASLRSLLPLEYIKGKRSISDHMNESVKYIKHLENKIKELSVKRDKLKKLSNFDGVDSEIRISSGIAVADPPITNASVLQYLGGLEVVLSRSIEEQMFPLSRLLDMLLEDGFTVVNCVYTKVEQRRVYTIHLEVSDRTNIDPSALQQKLSEAIPSSSHSSL